MKEFASNGAMAFSRSSEDEYWVFHPLVWIDLNTNAASNDIVSPVDIGTKDPFAVDICCAVLLAFRIPHSKDEFDSTISMVQPSTATIPFPDAVRDYLHADMTPYLLDKDFYRICEPLECPSIQPSLRILLGFPEFLISGLPLGKQANPAAVELYAHHNI